MPLGRLTRRAASGSAFARGLARGALNQAKEAARDRIASSALLPEANKPQNNFLMEYPTGVSNNTPFTKITAIKEITTPAPSLIGVGGAALSIAKNYLDNTIVLPLPAPSEMQQSTEINYSTGEVGRIARGLVGAAQRVSNAGAGGAAAEAAEAVSGLTDVLKEQAIINSLGILSRALSINVEGATQLQFRVTRNPNQATLFEDMNFREYSFSWVLVPKNEQESLQIQSIIQFLKNNIVPSSAGQIFYGVPHKFKIDFMQPLYDNEGRGETLNIFQMQQGYIKSVSDGYNQLGGDMHRFHPGWQPISINLGITFQEAELPDTRPPTANEKSVVNTVRDLANSYAVIGKEILKRAATQLQQGIDQYKSWLEQTESNLGQRESTLIEDLQRATSIADENIIANTLDVVSDQRGRVNEALLYVRTIDLDINNIGLQARAELYNTANKLIGTIDNLKKDPTIANAIPGLDAITNVIDHVSLNSPFSFA